MDAKSYVNKTVRKIKCGGDRKKEIRKELTADVNDRIRKGESIEYIIRKMGSPKEIADSFNENISAKEKKMYTWKRGLTVLISIAVCALLIAAAMYWFVPDYVDIEDSEYFSQAEVEAAAENTIELLDNEDYAALQENATGEMQSVLTKETIGEAKMSIADDWGTRQSIGSIYVLEAIQRGSHYVMAQVTVGYENVSVTYTLTYDEDMQLAGLYIK